MFVSTNIKPLTQYINHKRDGILYYLTMCFGPVAFLGQARGMSVYVPILAIVTVMLYGHIINFKNFDRWLMGSFGFLGCYAALSVLWSVSPMMSINMICHLLPLIISIIILTIVLHNASTDFLKIFSRGLLHGYIFLILTVAIDSIGQGMVTNFQNTLTGKTGTWFYANSSPSLIITSCFIWPTIGYLQHQFNKRFAAILYLLTLFLPFIIQHMAARASIISASLTFILIYMWPRLTLRILGVSIIGYTIVAPFVHAAAFEPMVNFWHEHLHKITHLSALHRVYIWSYVSDFIMQKPWLGWGLGAAKFLGGVRHHLPPHYFELLPNHPHNGVLHIWFELGLIGVIAFSVMIIRILSILAKITNRFQQASTSAAFVASLTVFSVSFSVWQSWWFATLGLLVASLIPLIRKSDQF